MFHTSTPQRRRFEPRKEGEGALRGESPLMLQKLRLACSEELHDIVTYLHDAVATEEQLGAVSSLFLSLAANEIEHYKALCRLLRVMGAPFHLQARIQIPPTEVPRAIPEDAVQLLTRRVASERAGEVNYRRLADAASDLKTRKLLMALAEEEAGHAEALSAMAARISHS